MASLWQFFGLPDPEAAPPSNRSAAPPPDSLKTESVQQNLAPIQEPVVTLTNEVPEPVGVQPQPKAVPLGWRGPMTADG